MWPFLLFSIKDSKEYQTFWIHALTSDPPCFCDFTQLLCTVQSEKEDAPLLTNYLSVWTFAFCLFQLKRKKEQKRKVLMNLERCKSSVWPGSVLCNHHNTIVIFLSRCYPRHPCFLLYYSIFEWCQVLYMVWIRVCKEEMWVSTGRCFIFVMKYIKLTYIQAGIMFFSFVVVNALYLIQVKRCRGWGCRGIRAQKGSEMATLHRLYSNDKPYSLCTYWLFTPTCSPLHCFFDACMHAHKPYCRLFFTHITLIRKMPARQPSCISTRFSCREQSPP